MDYDKGKVDNATLALLYLVKFDENEYGARAWKGFDWETLERLHRKNFITNPKVKSKSVGLTPEGCEKAKELFTKFFALNKN